ncbi:hypothetical protein FJZ48_02685 [Candidatus Uhrbacteria bacterium]|nr:hypothetical protein [Candidatus Uhrbacteria bacterium]
MFLGTRIKRVLVVEELPEIERTIRQFMEQWFSNKVMITGLWSFFWWLYTRVVEVHVEVSTRFDHPDRLFQWWGQILIENKPDEILVMISNSLNGMTGSELIEQLRGLTGGDRVHYVVMSSEPEVVRAPPGVSVISKFHLYKLRTLMQKM